MQNEKEKIVNKLMDILKTESEADRDLIRIFCEIISSDLTDGQKRLLLYFLYNGLSNDLTKVLSTRKYIDEKLDENSTTLRQKRRIEVDKLANGYGKIREQIGGILYDAIANDDLNDNQIEFFDSWFLQGINLERDSSMNRKLLNTLRGFSIKLCEDDRTERKVNHRG
jgi:hypothetical protein